MDDKATLSEEVCNDFEEGTVKELCVRQLEENGIAPDCIKCFLNVQRYGEEVVAAFPRGVDALDEVKRVVRSTRFLTEAKLMRMKRGDFGEVEVQSAVQDAFEQLTHCVHECNGSEVCRGGSFCAVFDEGKNNCMFPVLRKLTSGKTEAEESH